MKIQIKDKTFQAEPVAAFAGMANKPDGHVAWYSLRGDRGAHYTLVQFSNETFRLHRGIFEGDLGSFLKDDVKFSGVEA